MLAQFGTPIELLTNHRQEFLDAIEDLCTKALIDHCATSRDHLKAHGLVERVVYTVKHRLQKYGLFCGHHHDWNLTLPWIAMGY